jgi:hypothetical protein
MLDSHPDICGGPEFQFRRIPDIVTLRIALRASVGSGDMSVFVLSKTSTGKSACSLSDCFFRTLTTGPAD